MTEIKIRKLEDIKKYLENIPANRLIFWVGAGIDNGKPTCLPLGGPLTEFILQLTTNNKASKILNEWGNICKLIKSVVGEELEISDLPRLETVIEAVREFENHQIEKQSVMDGFSSFSSKEFHYNREHLLLAQYLHEGANIVTTNYGDFIKKAYEDIYGAGNIVCDHKDMYLYRAKNEWESCIYHIHGISSDLQTIGANLTTVKNSLPSSFKEIFMHWLEMKCVVIFMGYSGMDSLDVNPFFQTFCNEKNTKGIYVRHTNKAEIEPISEKEKVLLSAFEEKEICPCLTEDFFSVLINYGNKKNLDENDESHENDWKKVFEGYVTKYSEDYSNTFLLGLCYKLGMSMVKITGTKRWLKAAMKSDDIDLWYKNYYSFENALFTGQKVIIRIKGKQALKKDDKLMRNNYETAIGNYAKIVYTPKEEKLKDIQNKLNSNQVIDWLVSTELNRYIEYNFFEEIKQIMLNAKKKHINKRDIKIAMECLRLIKDGGYNCVMEVNQINTAYRSFALCQSLLHLENDNIINNLEIALNSYADVSSINGVTLTILYKILILLLDFYYNNNIESFNNARDILKVFQKLYYKSGLKKYNKHFVFMYVFYIYVRISRRKKIYYEE